MSLPKLPPEEERDKSKTYVEVWDGPHADCSHSFTAYRWVEWTPSMPEPHWNAQCFRTNLVRFAARHPREIEFFPNPRR